VIIMGKAARRPIRWGGVTACLLMSGATLMAAEPPPDWSIPDSLADGVGYRGDVRTGRDADGQPYKMLSVRPVLAGDGESDAARIISAWRLTDLHDYSVDYPLLREGQVIPVGGRLYRVDSAPRAGGSFLTVLDPGKLPQQVPNEVVPNPTSYTVPLFGYGELRGVRFRVIEVSAGANGAKATAEIQLYNGGAALGAESLGKVRRLTVEDGGELRIGPRAYHVRNIVPAGREPARPSSPGRDLIGWVELDPMPRVPGAPVPPWPPKEPEPSLVLRPTPLHQNYEAFNLAGSIAVHTPWVGEARAESPRDFTVRYPALKAGQILPALGDVYQLDFKSDRIGDQSAMKFPTLILADAEDLPAGAGRSPNSFAVPLHGYGRLHERWFHIADITQDEGQPPTARIEILGEAGWSVRNQPTDRHTAHAGESVRIGRKEYRALNIVPADARHDLVGWVEFAPVPIDGGPETDGR
jgi:hypothetical protein